MHLRWLIGPALLLGLAVGWALPHPAPARPPSPALRGPICEPFRAPSPSCDTERRDSCWSELAQRTAPRPTTLTGFEGVPEQEQPEALLPALEEALAGCDADAVIEVTDCSTYPCVAAVRPSKDWFETRCEWEGTESMSVVPIPLEVDCEGGSTESLFFVTMLTEDTAKSVLGIPEDEHPNGLISGMLGQRVDTLLEMWPCTGS